MSNRTYLLIALAFYGIFLRTAHLGRPTFSEDEFLHVYAARSIIQTGQPLLPGGRRYDRALPYTYMVTFSHRLFGESEFSSRIVSVLFDLLSIILVYILTVKFFNRTVGWISLALLAGSSFSIAMARYTRMYTLHQLLYLVVFFLTYLALEKDARANECAPPQRERLRWQAWGMLGLAGLAALFNFVIQSLSVFFVSGFFTFCVFEALRQAKRHGVRAAARSMPAVCAGLIAISALVALCLPGIREKLILELTWLPDWAKSDSHNYSFYRWFFMEQYSYVIYFILPGAAYFLRERSKFGLYLAASFSIPFLLLSFIPLKSERYIFNIFPFLLIWMAAGIYYVSSKLTEWLFAAVGKTRDSDLSRSSGKILAMVLGCASIILTPGFAITRKIHQMEAGNVMGVRYFPWREVQSFLENQRTSDPIIASRPAPVLYYCGRVNYSLDRLSAVENEELMRGAPVTAKFTDPDSGALFLRSLSDLTDAVKQNKRLWLVVEKSLLEGRKNRLSPEELQLIREQFKVVLTTRDGSIVILRHDAAERR